MPLIVKVTLCAIAMVMIALAAFRYEPEEVRLQSMLQSRLMDWWIRLDDRRIKTKITETRFLEYFASFVGRALDVLFGQRLLSWKAVSVSVAVSTSTSLIYMVIGKCTFWVGSPQRSAYVSGMLFILVVVVWYVGQRYMVDTNRTWVLIFCVCLLSLFVDDVSSFYIEANIPPTIGLIENVATEFLPALILSVSTDFATVLILRWLLRRLVSAQSWLTLFGFSLLIAIISGSVVTLPLLGGLAAVWETKPELERTANRIFLMFATLVFYNIGNFLLFFATSIFIGCLMLNRTLWQALERPLYALQRLKLYEHRKQLFAVAFALLGVALVPIKDSWGTAVIEVLKGFFGL